MFKRTQKSEDKQHADAVRLRFLREMDKFHMVVRFSCLTLRFEHLDQMFKVVR